MIRRILNLFSIAVFLTAGGMAYAYVYDVDCVSPAEVYLLERSAFIFRGGDIEKFPDFTVWLGARTAFDWKLRDWVGNWLNKIGVEFARIWEPDFKLDPIQFYHLEMPVPRNGVEE